MTDARPVCPTHGPIQGLYVCWVDGCSWDVRAAAAEEEIRQLVISVPMPGNRGNARWHHAVEHKAKKAYWDQLNLRASAGLIPRRWPGDTPELCEVEVHMYVWNQMDEDNAAARLKWVMDWLEGNDYVHDDGAGVRWAGMPEQSIDRKDQRIVVRLRAVDP